MANKTKLSRKQVATLRNRGTGGKFVQGLKTAKFNLPANIVPDAHVEHISTFRSIPMLPANVYRNLDEALRHDQVNARAMRRDPHLMELLFSRQIAVAQLPWEIIPDDPKDPFQVSAARTVYDIIADIPRFTEYKRNLLEALWFGRYAIVNNFGFDWKAHKRRMVVKSWQPIMGDKLQFRMDDTDTVGYLVNPARATGIRKLEIGYDGPIEMFSGTDRRCIVVHKHFINDAHYMEWEGASGIEGVGLRNYLYWAWLHRQELIAFMMNAMERYGFGGFQLWYFEAGNPDSEKAVRQAAEMQTGNNVILFPKPTGTEQGPGLEIVEPNGNGLDAFLALINGYFNAQMERMIVGTAISGSGGDEKKSINPSEAALADTAFGRLLQYDADNLAETLTKELVSVIQDYNFPGSDYRLKMKLNLQKPDPAKLLEASQRLFEMGCSINEREVRTFAGLSEPQDGDVILKKQTGEEQSIKHPKKEIGELESQLA